MNSAVALPRAATSWSSGHSPSWSPAAVQYRVVSSTDQTGNQTPTHLLNRHGRSMSRYEVWGLHLIQECRNERRHAVWIRRAQRTTPQVFCATVANSSTTLEAGSKPLASKLVLVVGATGGVGQFIVASLLEKGAKVRALVRSTEKAESLYKNQLDDRIELRIGDTRKPETIDNSIFAGVTHVIHSTGTTAFPTPRWRDNNGPEQTDWIAVRNFVDALPKTLERVVLVSSIAVTKYDKWPFIILNLFGVLKYKKMGEDHLRKSGVPFTIIRPGQLPDAPVKDTVETLHNVVLGQGDNLIGRATRVDVAEGCVQSLNLAVTEGQTYELVCLEGNGPGKDAEKWAALFSDMKIS